MKPLLLVLSFIVVPACAWADSPCAPRLANQSFSQQYQTLKDCKLDAKAFAPFLDSLKDLPACQAEVRDLQKACDAKQTGPGGKKTLAGSVGGTADDRERGTMKDANGIARALGDGQNKTIFAAPAAAQQGSLTPGAPTGSLASGANPLLDGGGSVPGVMTAAEGEAASCRAAVGEEHSSIAGMCASHSFIAPVLAGVLDAVQEQFGTVSGIVTNIAFMLVGLLAAVATGGVALILKLAGLVVAGWAIIQMVTSLVKAVSAYASAPDGSPEKARALRAIGQVGGGLLIAVAMALGGYAIGKTAPGAKAIEAMEGGMAGALDKVGATALMAKMNSMLPTAALERFLGKAPESRSSFRDKNQANIERNLSLGDADRMKAATEAGFSQPKAEAIVEAHKAAPCAGTFGPNRCTFADIRKKFEIFKAAGMERPEMEKALDLGLAGGPKEKGWFGKLFDKGGGSAVMDGEEAAAVTSAAQRQALRATIDPAVNSLFQALRSGVKEGDLIHATTARGLKGIQQTGKIRMSTGKYADYGTGVYVQKVSAADVALLKQGSAKGLYSLTEHGRAASLEFGSPPVVLRIVKVAASEVKSIGPNGELIPRPIPIEQVQAFDPKRGVWVDAKKYSAP